MQQTFIKSIFILSATTAITTCFAITQSNQYSGMQTIKKNQTLKIIIHANKNKIKNFTISDKTIQQLMKASPSQQRNIYFTQIEPLANFQYNTCCIYLHNSNNGSNLDTNYLRYTFPNQQSKNIYPFTMKYTGSLKDDTEGSGVANMISGKYGSAFCNSSYAPSAFQNNSHHYELRCSTCQDHSTGGQCKLQNKGNCTITLKNTSYSPIKIGIYCGEGIIKAGYANVFKGSQTGVTISH